jgi:hypothetical protein
MTVLSPVVDVRRKRHWKQVQKAEKGKESFCNVESFIRGKEYA